MPQESRYSLQMDNPPLVDYGHGALSPSRAAYRNSDIDFRDVFGGPPRRSSVHDVRYSFTEGMDSVEASRRTIGEASVRDPWTAAEGKPVFGEAESVNRRRYVREDFFNDIFKGGESPNSTPRNVFSLSPGSRALSPARGDGSGTGSPSSPSQFSLPDKVSKGMELPTFGSTPPNRGTSLDPPKVSVFGFSTRAQDDSKTDNHPSYRPSPLSQQFSHGSKKIDDSKKDSVVEPQFHFSIYKWANPIPLVMPLNRTNSKNLKERQAGQTTFKDVHPAADLHDDVLPVNQVLKEEVREEKIELKPLESFLRDKLDESGKADLSTGGKNKEQQRTKKVSKNKDEVSFKKQDAESTVPKKDNAKKQDAESQKPAGPDSTPKRRGKASKVKDFIRIFNQETPSKPRTPNSPRTSRGSGRDKESTATMEAETQQEKSKGGDVDAEKIKISKADSSKPRSANTQKEPATTVEAAATQQEKNRTSAVNDEKINISKTADVPEKKSDAYDDKNGSTTRRSQKESSKSSTSTPKPPPSSHSSSSSTKKNTETFPQNTRETAEEADDSSHANFTIKELSEEEQKQGEATGESEEIQATDAKIHQWARGKEGNIRSLLTTLQLVLWPGSGWKPVALMNIIEGPGVKRAYQKAMLCLHPDKLQQKGASSHQKYIAEKVFDILQEAWDHFNTLGGL